MKKEKIYEIVNKKIDTYIFMRENVTTKEVTFYVLDQCKNLEKDIDLSLAVRNRLSYLTRENKISRISKGIYNVSIDLNYEREHQFEDTHTVKQFVDILDKSYKDKWSFSKRSLLRNLKITNQVSKTETINIKLRQENDKFNNLLIAAKKAKIKLKLVNLKHDEDIFLYSLVELLYDNLLEDSFDTMNIIKSLEKRGYEISDMFLYDKIYNRNHIGFKNKKIDDSIFRENLNIIIKANNE